MHTWLPIIIKPSNGTESSPRIMYDDNHITGHNNRSLKWYDQIHDQVLLKLYIIICIILCSWYIRAVANNQVAICVYLTIFSSSYWECLHQLCLDIHYLEMLWVDIKICGNVPPHPPSVRMLRSYNTNAMPTCMAITILCYLSTQNFMVTSLNILATGD